MDFRTELSKLISNVIGIDADEIAAQLEVPPKQEMGDYAFPCFKIGGKPKADEIAAALKGTDFLTEVRVVGPYVNFYLHTPVLAKHTLESIQREGDKYGSHKGTQETVMVEFFHANTHKGVHIGHIRNISMGAAICRLLEAVGKKVIRVNYQGDIGPHVAKCIWGYLHFKEQEPEEHKGIWLGKLYAKASQKIKGDAELEAEVAELNSKIYQHDPEVEEIWQKTRGWCLDDFNAFYKQFGVAYDQLYFESDAAPRGKKVVEEILEKGVATKSDGALIVDLSDHDLDVYVAVTGKGNPTYQGKELGLAQIKQDQFTFDKSIHVVGSEQELFFKQVFKTYELMGSPMASKSHHVSYGLVNLPEGKMSSRLGTMILYHNLYEELMRLATQEVKKRHESLVGEDLRKRAEMITFAAIKFSMIARENKKSLTFDWKRALDFEGETGPYVQYAHARCASILRKADLKLDSRIHYPALSTSHEKKLLTHLYKYTDIVLFAADNYKPYLVANYLLELAQAFNEFYHACPVISEASEVMKARLLLVTCVKQVISNGLGLLGIAAPEEM